MTTQSITRYATLGIGLASLALLSACGGDSAPSSPTQPDQTLPAVSAIKVLPAVVDVGVGRTMHIQATAFGSDSAQEIGRTYTFAIGNSRIATLNGTTGEITGVSAGTTTLSVTTGGKTTVIPVSVATLGSGTFRIDLRFGPNVSTTLHDAAVAAVQRWQNVITAPLIPYLVQVNAGDCGFKAPAINELVPNMIVYVQGDSIDGPGGTAGEGGPCILRDDQPETTAFGTLTVDTADIASASRQGVLIDLLTHEIGHIIGIGTLWGGPPVGPPPVGYIPNTALGLGTDDPEFIGRNGRVASAELGFTSDSSKGVPIENTGGPGTADGHWRESLFSHELMTGTLDSGGNPLSLVTIEAIADLGYTVQPDAAEDFSFVNATAPSNFGTISTDILAPSSRYKIGEILLRPKFTMTKSGVKKGITKIATQLAR